MHVLAVAPETGGMAGKSASSPKNPPTRYRYHLGEERKPCAGNDGMLRGGEGVACYGLWARHCSQPNLPS